jgi:hypothetical protein
LSKISDLNIDSNKNIKNISGEVLKAIELEVASCNSSDIFDKDTSGELFELILSIKYDKKHSACLNEITNEIDKISYLHALHSTTSKHGGKIQYIVEE